MIIEATMSLFNLYIFLSLYFIFLFIDDIDFLMGWFCVGCIVMIVFVFMTLLFF